MKSASLILSVIFLISSGLKAVAAEQTGSSNWFMYDGADVVTDYIQLTSGGELDFPTVYLQGLGVDSKLIQIDSDNSALTYLPDGLGSVHQTFSNGTVTNQALTNAWGEDFPEFATFNLYGFTQRENDPRETGLIYFRARHYNPVLGRFLQKDPVSNGSGHYYYVRNSATNFKDPFGLEEVIAYHQTDLNSAIGIASDRFKASSGLNWFATSPSSLGGPSMAGKDITLKVNLNIPANVKTIDAAKMFGFFDTAKNLLTAAGENFPVSGPLSSQQQSMIDAVRWKQLVPDYLKSLGGESFKIELSSGKGDFYVIGDKSINSVVKGITGVSGKGSEKVLDALGKRPGVSIQAVHSQQEQIQLQTKGRINKYIKWGGRIIMVVAIASDVYELYEGGWQSREITKKVGAWTASLTAAGYVGIKTAPWAVTGWGAVGTVTATLGAGIGGYFFGGTITEIGYDYVITPAFIE